MQESAPSLEERRSVERLEMPGRGAPSPRLPVVNADLMKFSARERRNRWIGFGSSEIAALTSVILLGHYEFTHHFPDPTLKLLIFILLLAAIAIAVALPIAFLRNDPARWERRA
jgi:hypothetical protein